jgi:hypothetical protein
LSPAPLLGQVTRWALPGAPVDEALLFSAAPLPDDTYALTWLDGRSSHLTRRTWTAQSPVQAGYALHLGREQARIVRELGWFPADDQVEVLEVAITYAAQSHPVSLLGWFALGFFGGRPS